jgi:tRNA G18 (ribose-2'-O)-methylase SpoU
MHSAVDLIGDGIENPWNAKALIDAAHMFGSSCLFRDRKGLAQSLREIEIESPEFITCDDVAKRYSPILALENLGEADDVYGFQKPLGSRSVLITGNEKFGIAQDLRRIANNVVRIPMPGVSLNTLNVAAAAGVALYYLSTGAGGKLQVRSKPHIRRPEVLLMGAGDHVELGSAIRSAGAFGWNRLFIEDREQMWFGCDRVKRSEGRGAARRGRNSIRLVPVQMSSRFVFREVLIVSSKQGIPLDKANLASGPRQVLVIPDESHIDLSNEPWERLGANVQFAQIKVPSSQYAYRYRLFASIALAEAARQIGQRPVKPGAKVIRQGLVYDSSLAVLLNEIGEEVLLEDLQIY